MTKVTVETVDHVAKLAHLQLTNEEREMFARQLRDILAYAESIQALDTSAVPPMSHAGIGERLRDDTPEDSLDHERVLAEAPDAALGFFRVPRVIG